MLCTLSKLTIYCIQYEFYDLFLKIAINIQVICILYFLLTQFVLYFLSVSIDFLVISSLFSVLLVFINLRFCRSLNLSFNKNIEFSYESGESYFMHKDSLSEHIWIICFHSNYLVPQLLGYYFHVHFLILNDDIVKLSGYIVSIRADSTKFVSRKWNSIKFIIKRADQSTKDVTGILHISHMNVVRY